LEAAPKISSTGDITIPAALTEKVSTVEKRLKDLEAAPTAASIIEEELRPTLETFATIVAVQNLEERVGSFATTASVLKLEERVGSLEALETGKLETLSAHTTGESFSVHARDSKRPSSLLRWLDVRQLLEEEDFRQGILSTVNQDPGFLDALANQLQERLGPTQPSVEELQALVGDSKPFIDLSNDLRLVKIRFDSLDRCVAQDRQESKDAAAMRQKSKEQDEAERSRKQQEEADVLNGVIATLMKRLAEFREELKETFSDEQALASKDTQEVIAELRREVANISLAVKSVQRDDDNAKDFRRDLAVLRGRLEQALPKVCQAIEELSTSGPPPAESEASSEQGGENSPSNVEALRALVRKDAPPFVTQQVLNQAIKALQGELRWSLHQATEALRAELFGAMRYKADGNIVHQLAERVQHVRVLPEGRPGRTADDTSIVRWPLMRARCVSCDSPVEVHIDEHAPWPQHRTIPNNRGPPRVGNTILLNSMRRDASQPVLPTL
jgi:hypothetical protein